MRFNMIDIRCFNISAFFQAFHAKRVFLQICFPGFLPSTSVSSVRSRTALFRMQGSVFITVLLSGKNQCTAARVFAWHIRFVWHRISSKRKAPSVSTMPVSLPPCKELRWRKCSNPALSEVSYIPCDNTVCLDPFCSHTL